MFNDTEISMVLSASGAEPDRADIESVMPSDSVSQIGSRQPPLEIGRNPEQPSSSDRNVRPSVEIPVISRRIASSNGSSLSNSTSSDHSRHGTVIDDPPVTDSRSVLVLWQGYPGSYWSKLFSQSEESGRIFCWCYGTEESLYSRTGFMDYDSVPDMLHPHARVHCRLA